MELRMKPSESKRTIELCDTRESTIGRISGVPAKSEEEACKKVSDKRGFRWIGMVDGQYFAHDNQKHGRTQEAIEELIQAILDGEIDTDVMPDECGFIELLEVPPAVEWESL